MVKKKIRAEGGGACEWRFIVSGLVRCRNECRRNEREGEFIRAAAGHGQKVSFTHH